ncbi:RING/U-box [Exidia glandulosa HHB12029]|uniref:RING/U-box n=1 Tax=Exidia glandulosa HHB12029 TaxID=1314781 RepID=A0A165PDX8_EXIGL|nr:RING/U-box [Exidia glandulosa HHB12029]
MPAPGDESDDSFDFNEDELDQILAVQPLAQPAAPPPAPIATAPVLHAVQATRTDDDDFFDDFDEDTLAALDAFEAAYARQEQDAAAGLAPSHANQAAAVPAQPPAGPSAAPIRPAARASRPGPAASIHVSSSPAIESSLPASSAMSNNTNASTGTKRHRTSPNSPRKRRRTSSKLDLFSEPNTLRVDKSTVEKLAEEAQCPVCFEHMAEPHSVVPCGHSVCADCLNTWLTTKKKASKQLECPVCRSVLDPDTAVVPNFTLKSVLTATLPLLPADKQQTWLQRTEAWKGTWTYNNVPVPVVPLFLPDFESESDDDDLDSDSDDDISDDGEPDDDVENAAVEVAAVWIAEMPQDIFVDLT